MSGTQTNPDHSHPCSITLASISFICFPHLFPLSIFLCNITHSQVKATFLINKKSKTNLHFYLQGAGPDYLLRCRTFLLLQVLLELLQLLVNLLWIDLPLTFLLRRDELRCKNWHSSKKVSRPALRWSLDHETDRVESAIWAIWPVIASTVAIKRSICSRKGPVLKPDLDPDGPATSTILSSSSSTFTVFFFLFSPPCSDVAASFSFASFSFALPFPLSTTGPGPPTSGNLHFSFKPAHFMHARCFGFSRSRSHTAQCFAQRTHLQKGVSKTKTKESRNDLK